MTKKSHLVFFSPDLQCSAIQYWLLDRLFWMLVTQHLLEPTETVRCASPVLTCILWVLIIWSYSWFICLYFSSVRGVRADSSSGLSPPLFSFLFNACRVPPKTPPNGQQTDGRKKRDRKKKERERGGRGEWEEGPGSVVLTHSLCLLIIRSMSSFIFLYFSSDSGLWPTESSASGSGLSQPFRPFFLNVCKQSSRTTQLKGRGTGPRVEQGRGNVGWSLVRMDPENGLNWPKEWMRCIQKVCVCLKCHRG